MTKQLDVDGRLFTFPVLLASESRYGRIDKMNVWLDGGVEWWDLDP